MEITDKAQEVEHIQEPSSSEPWKIGGFLYLVAIGVFISPIRLINSFIQTFIPIFSDGRWDDITTIGNEAVFGLIVFEILGNILLIGLSAYLAVQFIQKNSTFPKWYFGIALTGISFVVVDLYIASLLFPEHTFFNDETVEAILPALVSILIWSPYLFFSERSKNTFVCK